jgi:hypothetical protein
LNGEEKALPDPDRVIFVVGLMEHDDGNPEALRGIAAAQLSAALFATLGADRRTVASRALQTLGSAVQVPTGGPSTDEAVGGTKEAAKGPRKEAIPMIVVAMPLRAPRRAGGEAGTRSFTIYRS